MKPTPRLRQTKDTPPTESWAWRFVVLNLFQIASLIFFASVALLVVFANSAIPYRLHTGLLFAAAAVTYMLLLIWPSRRWVRVVSLVAPALAVGSRVLDLVGSPPQPALALWAFTAFVFTWAAPRLMPPPLANGERRRWLADGEGRRFG